MEARQDLVPLTSVLGQLGEERRGILGPALDEQCRGGRIPGTVGLATGNPVLFPALGAGRHEHQRHRGPNDILAIGPPQLGVMLLAQFFVDFPENIAQNPLPTLQKIKHILILE